MLRSHHTLDVDVDVDVVRKFQHFSLTIFSAERVIINLKLFILFILHTSKQDEHFFSILDRWLSTTILLKFFYSLSFLLQLTKNHFPATSFTCTCVIFISFFFCKTVVMHLFRSTFLGKTTTFQHIS